MVEYGVSDYEWSRFSLDIEMAIVERMLLVINMCNNIKPQPLFKLLAATVGDEKVNQFEKLIESGVMNKPFLLLTSLYVNDKDNFLMPGGKSLFYYRGLGYQLPLLFPADSYP